MINIFYRLFLYSTQPLNIKDKQNIWTNLSPFTTGKCGVSIHCIELHVTNLLSKKNSGGVDKTYHFHSFATLLEYRISAHIVHKYIFYINLNVIPWLLFNTYLNLPKMVAFLYSITSYTCEEITVDVSCVSPKYVKHAYYSKNRLL